MKQIELCFAAYRDPPMPAVFDERKSEFAEVIMALLYLMIIMFSALTLYLIYGDYRKKQFPKKTFTFVGILEAVVIIISAALLIKSC